MGPLALLLGLLSAEAAVGVGAYLLAYALFLDNDSWRNRFVSLAPYGIVPFAWWVVYNSLGYGTKGSGFYLDPVNETWRYLWSAIERSPILLLGQWGFPFANIYALLPSADAQSL